MSSTFIDWALRYARHGFPVFPLHPGTKVPFRRSNGVDDASRDEDRIRRSWTDYPTANIGLALGEQAGAFALDVDIKDGGDQTLAALERQHGALPPTCKVITHSGGFHFYFRHVPGIKNSVGKNGGIASGLDIKTSGGYVVAPPSIIHDTGNAYSWVTDCSLEKMPIAAAPEWLIGLALHKSRGKPSILVSDDPNIVTEDTSPVAQVARHFSERCEPEGGGWRTRCPIHGGHSLLLRHGDKRLVIGYCHGGNCDKDAVQEAIDIALTELDHDPWQPLPQPEHALQAEEKTKPKKHLMMAAKVWRGTVPIARTPAEWYLRNARGITIPLPETLRFHPDCFFRPKRIKLPALIAKLEKVGVKGGVAIQRTYLRRDGAGKSPLKPNKASLAPVKGAAIRLAEAGETLAIAEGIETGLSFMQLTGYPTWVTCGHDFESLVLPQKPLASTVIIARDRDSASTAAANDAAERFAAQGRKVIFATPDEGYGDFNDELLGNKNNV